MLTPKQRLIRAIRGEEVDRVPFSPFLAYYFDSLPLEIRQKGQLSYLEDMGADPLLRGMATGFSVESSVCRKEEKESENKRYTTIYTPKGELHLEHTYVKGGNTWFLTEHPVKDVNDLAALRCYYQDLTIKDRSSEVNETIKAIGERALLVPVIGVEMKSSFQSMLEYWVGTENLIYLCIDFPDEIEETLYIMRKTALKTIEYTLHCNVEACISWEDSSTGNISPTMYEQYISPEISEWNRLCRENDIVYIQHACGLLKDLLLPISRQGVKCIESLTPFPTGNVSMEKANRILPPDVSIIGGIDPIMMLNASDYELEEYVERILPIASSRGFILSNSDSCPPDVSYQRFLKLASIVSKY